MMVAGQVSVAGFGQALNVGQAELIGGGAQWCVPQATNAARPPTTV